MSERELSDRVTFMERKLQRIRLAIIVIAAFFVYQAIGPLTLGTMTFGEGRGGEQVEVQRTVKAQELIVVDELGKTVAYLSAAAGGAKLVLHDADGNRLVATAPGVMVTALEDGVRVERLRIPQPLPE